MDDEERLRELYPAWHIRRHSNEQMVMATRKDRAGLTRDELFAGLCMTLIEDTPDRLRTALAGQQDIESAL